MTEDQLVDAVSGAFRTFGGGRVGSGENPISAVLAGEPPSFAAGVDVREVVRFIMAHLDGTLR